jgi:hypothetical protein
MTATKTTAKKLGTSSRALRREVMQSPRLHTQPFPTMWVKVEKVGLHTLEVLNLSQWSSLEKSDKPWEFTRLNPDCYVRITAD